jgi:hypothetical protein
MQTIKAGSKWHSTSYDFFWVIDVVEVEGAVWVHYKDQSAREYSCLADSFLHRFRQQVNQ